MTEENYQDGFESFLHDSVDDFKMYPTRKIWRGIYNDVHPAKKWPSLAMTLVLIGILLYVGISNNYRINYEHASKNSQILEKKVEILRYGRIYDEPEADALVEEEETNNSSDRVERNEGVPSYSPATQNAGSLTKRSKDEPLMGLKPFLPDIINYERFPHNPVFISPITSINTPVSKELAIQRTIIPTRQIDVVKKDAVQDAIPVVEKMQDSVEFGLSASDYRNYTTTKRGWENNATAAIQNRQYFGYEGLSPYIAKKYQRRLNFLKKLSYSYYITPSIGYRGLYKNNHDQARIAFPNNLINLDFDRFFRSAETNQYGDFNFEAGLAGIYELNKKWNLKAGFQVNHSSFSIDAVELSHPTQTYLNIRNASTNESELVPTTTYFATEGNFAEHGTRLSSKQFQVSVPVGIEYKAFEKKNLSMVVGATVQPTLIAKDNSYLLSHNDKNYVMAPNMVNKFNIYGSLETLVGYDLPDGIKVFAGPQFRYQFRSTFKPNFNYTENRYNLGLKIGFTKRILQSEDKE